MLAYKTFFKTLPTVVLPHIAPDWTIQSRQPFYAIIQFYDSDTTIHYECHKPAHRKDLEIGLHFESKNKQLNSRLLQHFDHRLVELQDVYGSELVAEPWDRGWAKVYELYPAGEWTEAYHAQVGKRMATFINTIHPYLLDALE